jgi:hypothetical protein
VSRTLRARCIQPPLGEIGQQDLPQAKPVEHAAVLRFVPCAASLRARRGAHSAEAVLVRPDHQVFGTRDPDRLNAAYLAATGTALPDGSLGRSGRRGRAALPFQISTRSSASRRRPAEYWKAPFAATCQP